MDISANDCRFCHSPLTASSKFCQNCGAPVDAPLKQSSEQPETLQQGEPLSSDQAASQAQMSKSQSTLPPVSSPPPPQPTNPPNRPRSRKANPCLVVIGVIGIALICLSILAVATNSITNGAIHQVLQVITKRVPESGPVELESDPTESAAPTLALMATPEAVEGYLPFVIFAGKNENPQDAYPAVQEEGSEGGAAPLIFEMKIVDDFSSTIYGWDQSDTDISTFDYDLTQGIYYIHVKKPSYISWSEVPVGFIPQEIEFDAINPANNTGGSFGVMCQMQNSTSYYIVEIDTEKMVFSISMAVEEAYIPLTDPEWLELTNIDPAIGRSNHYGVSCGLDHIRLFTNGNLIGEADFSDKTPFSTPGKMAIFVATWENVSPEGYQVYFDNVNVWMP